MPQLSIGRDTEDGAATLRAATRSAVELTVHRDQFARAATVAPALKLIKDLLLPGSRYAKDYAATDRRLLAAARLVTTIRCRAVERTIENGREFGSPPSPDL